MAIFYIGVFVGKPIGRQQVKHRQDAVDPDLHDQLGDFVLTVFAPCDNLDEVTVLPGKVRDEAQRLAAEVGAARRAARRTA